MITTSHHHEALFPLSFAEVVVFLGSVHLISTDRNSPLEARIKDFQRRGFPKGLNTGKGRPAAYGPAQVLLLGLAFECLELGMAPDRICRLMTSAGDHLVAELKKMCGGGVGFRGMFDAPRSVLYFDPQGLAYLRQGSDGDPEDGGLRIGTPAELKRMFERRSEGSARLAVVDLKQFLAETILGLEGAKNMDSKLIIDAMVDWGVSRDSDTQA